MFIIRIIPNTGYPDDNLILHEESNKENNDNDEVNENDKVLLAFKNALDSIKTW